MSRTTVKFVGMASIMALLSACGGGGSSLSSSSTFASNTGTVSGGQVNVNLSSELNDSVSDADVGLVAFVTGTNTTRGTANAVSGIQSGANVGSAVGGGTVTYNARYKYGVVDDVNRTSTFITGDRAHSSESSIALSADFGAGTLTGNTADLAVNGTISGQTLGGTVDVSHSIIGNAPGTVTADLQGQIGSTGVIGAFAGKDNDTVVAGGFVGEP